MISQILFNFIVILRKITSCIDYNSDKDGKIPHAINKTFLDKFLISVLCNKFELLNIRFYLTSTLKFKLQYPKYNTWVNNLSTCFCLNKDNKVFGGFQALMKSNKDSVSKHFINSGKMDITLSKRSYYVNIADSPLLKGFNKDALKELNNSA